MMASWLNVVVNIYSETWDFIFYVFLTFNVAHPLPLKNVYKDHQSKVTIRIVVKCNYPRTGNQEKGIEGPQKGVLEVSYFIFL